MNDQGTIIIVAVFIIGVLIAGWITYGIAKLILKKVDSMRDNEDSESEESKYKITIYTDAGEIIKQYSGCVNVESDEYFVAFDDENGKNHEIYYSSGIVVIAEE